jgi:hypothetical protein
MRSNFFIKNKRGYFFSLDALIALLIIIGVVIFIKPPQPQNYHQENIHSDLLDVLSNLKIGDINNSYVKQLIANGNITNLNQSVLEQIGEFYANGDPLAQQLAENILTNLNLQENVGLYFDNILIADAGSVSYNDAEEIATSRQIISGIQAGGAATGFSSRAFLFAENKVEYFYLGGYVGDGNITARFEGNITSAKIEGVFSDPFDVYINSIFADNYVPISNVPFTIDLNPHLGKFGSGENLIQLKSSNEKLFVAGGFIKVTYSDVSNLSTSSVKKFPGIDGLINIYDSVYIPGNLTNMEVFLHYNSSYDILMSIGNETIYEDNSGGAEETVSIPNSVLSTIFNYVEISRKNLPVRLGLKDVALFGNLSEVFDVFSVTDLSSSMNAQTSSGEKVIDIARTANKQFARIILNESITEADNRVGLVGYHEQHKGGGSYYATYLPENYHNLSINQTSLDNKIDDWTTKSGTCICCGILKATEAFSYESEINKSKVMVVMSDGNANVACNTNDPEQDAIDAACNAFNNDGIRVYSIGFGDQVDQETMEAIASCGGGNYYFGTVEQLIDLYEQAAQDIIRAVYEEQTIISDTVTSILYPDSYIALQFQKDVPYGLLISTETSAFGNNITEGTFTIPYDAEPFDAGIVSYSGPKWTDNLEVYNNATGSWERVFNLGDYSENYTKLGDPYIVHLPSDKIVKGENRIRISTGLSSTNSSGGSIFDKAIYSVVKNLSSYTPVVASAEGCTWTIEFEDGTNTSIKVPLGYSGANICSYLSTNSPSPPYSFGELNSNDAVQLSIYALLNQLDLNSNGKIETKFTENDLTIESVEISGIPFTWETEVQSRVWR